MAVPSAASTMSVWATSPLRVVSRWHEHVDKLTTCVFVPHLDALFTASLDKTIRVYSVDPVRGLLEPTARLTGHKLGVRQVG